MYTWTWIYRYSCLMTHHPCIYIYIYMTWLHIWHDNDMTNSRPVFIIIFIEQTGRYRPDYKRWAHEVPTDQRVIACCHLVLWLQHQLWLFNITVRFYKETVKVWNSNNSTTECLFKESITITTYISFCLDDLTR